MELQSRLTDLQSAVRILRRRQVQHYTGLSRSELYRQIARGEFPRQVRIGRKSVGWIEAEIQEYLTQRVAESRKAA